MEREIIFRFAKEDDLPVIADVYNQAIRSGIATGHTQEFSIEERKEWFAKFDKNSYPIYVVEAEGVVIGYGTLSPYREGRQAMRSIAEISFFFDKKFQGKGYGSILLENMINDCPNLKIKNLIAILLDVNFASIALLEKFGFEKWGHLPEVIEFEDKLCGQLFYVKNVV